MRALVILLLLISPGFAKGRTEVWFSPNSQAPDFTDLFDQPQLWPRARGLVDVFMFAPDNVSTSQPGPVNGYGALRARDVFRKLNAWHIATAIAAPSVKEWDCSARGNRQDPRVKGNALATTQQFIGNVHDAGGAVRYIAMDEPLSSGLGLCHQSMQETADAVAGYVTALRSSNPDVAVGDVEPYPSKTLSQLEEWVGDLQTSGFTPAFFHLDVDSHNVTIQGSKLDFDGDLKALKRFLFTHGIPFGIIFWGGYDPEASDESFYRHTADWAARVIAATGRPDHAIFESWVTRAASRCSTGVACNRPNNWLCGPSDPPYCGMRSVPLNLPESGQAVFSATKLLDATMATMPARPP